VFILQPPLLQNNEFIARDRRLAQTGQVNTDDFGRGGEHSAAVGGAAAAS